MAKSKKQSSKKTVVCVEDDFLFSEFLSLMLERDGFKVVSVGTGKDAISTLEDLQPDLVILDLMLPDLHGWQIIEKMREQPALRDIPIIVVTALSSDADRTFAEDIAGVHAYLTKPVAPGDIRRAVATALSDD
jgi:CheY-like chemotaxis protein